MRSEERWISSAISAAIGLADGTELSFSLLIRRSKILRTVELNGLTQGGASAPAIVSDQANGRELTQSIFSGAAWVRGAAMAFLAGNEGRRNSGSYVQWLGNPAEDRGRAFSLLGTTGQDISLCPSVRPEIISLRAQALSDASRIQTVRTPAAHSVNSA